MFAFFRQHATGRSIVISFAVVAALAGLSQFVLVPAYGDTAGFVPMDLQHPLTREMVAFQRGALGPGAHAAYLRFAVVNILSAMAVAVFVSLLWCWLALQAPQTFATPALHYGLLLLPAVSAVCTIADTTCIAQLVFADTRDPMHAFTDTTLMVHAVDNLLNIAVRAISIGLAALALISMLMDVTRQNST